MVFVNDKGGGEDFPLVPQGTTPGWCIRVYDIGEQRSEKYGVKPKVVLVFELPEHRIDVDGNMMPMQTSNIYTQSLHEKADLRKHLDMWRGKAFSKEELANFDLNKVAGVPAMITITHNEKGGKTYANITALTSMPASYPKPPGPVARVFTYDIGQPIPEDMHKWVVNKLEQAVQPPEMPTTSERQTESMMDDDAPPF